jgi:hypothetical protein
MECRRLSQSRRKLIGTVAILLLVVVYPAVVVLLFGPFLGSLAGWQSIPLFAVLGLLWFVPAAWVIRWMVRPD